MATRDTLLRDVLGPKVAATVEKSAEMVTVGDLLRHYPRRVNQRGELTDLSALVEGELATVMAEIVNSSARRIPGRKLQILEVEIRSGQNKAYLSFFNQNWRESQLKPGMHGMFAGKVSRFKSKLQLNQPEYVLFESDDPLVADDFANQLIPVYPSVQGLPSWTWSRFIRLALDQLDEVPDPLPTEVRARAGLVGLDAALRAIHRPQSMQEYRNALRRLKFDEAFAIQLILAQRRHAIAANPAVARPRRHGGLVDRFDELLPFELTGEQRELGDLLERELAAEHPMQRLLQGEVGSGKTVVALRAMLQAVDAGAQAALLAPTEVLAGQHEQTVLDLLGPLARAGQLGGDENGTKVVLLTGSMSAQTKRAALLDAASGAAGIVIGTHALIQDNVQFADLGMVVVDEQHRFGVEQRDALRGKASKPPHMLVMTATPIPRTVAMTVFGDLETSELRERPSGRKDVTTTVVPADRPAWVERVWQRVREEVDAGRQVYVVCPRIGEGEEVDLMELGESEVPEGAPKSASVLATLAELSANQLQGLRLGLMHGRLAADEKARVMADFAAGQVDVLVSTTVIEVGVNVPNASVMVVLDADRFGVSQLHQLRGRIGRGGHEGVCLLLTSMPEEHPSRTRLNEVAATNDGFALAFADLEQRREGDVLGAAQSGRKSALKLLSLLRDEDLILLAREEAREVIAADPTLAAHRELEMLLWDMFDSENADYLNKT